MRKTITNEQREKAWRMYEKNNTISQIARSIGVSYTSAWFLIEGKRQGFKNYSEYRESLAIKKGFKNRSEYQESLAVKKGFKNYSEYRESLAQQRSRNHQNKELSDLIKSRLKKLKRTQSWLAEQIGVTRQAVSLYSIGKIIPQNKTLNLLFSA